MTLKSRWSRVGLGAALVLVGFLRSPATEAERTPFFAASVIFAGGETNLALTDSDATRINLPPAFDGWGCYIGDTQRVGVAFTKQVTCGGPWGFVDTFVSCDPKHRNAMASLRLRQAVQGTKAEIDTAEKVTIAAGCGYSKK